MKKYISILCVLVVAIFLTNSGITVFAVGGPGEIYSVYSGDELICELSDIAVDDEYISKDFKLYRITEVDDENHTAQAIFIKQYKKPDVSRSQEPSNIGAVYKNIGMYMSHNDESYEPTDGTYSIYGAGGIHDVAKTLRSSLRARGMDVELDETLHIPHDAYAYSRSAVTAENLLESYNLNAIFDIHRDGASRSFYVTTVDGEEKCHVRMVVGKSNPDYDTTLEFATCLMAVGEELYPWLFSDIYIGHGVYNQDLSSKAILFEMGSHLVEKELVEESMPALAEVIDVALFGTTINEDDGSLTINGNSEDDSTVNEYFDEENVEERAEQEATSSGLGIAGIVLLLLAGVGLFAFFGINMRRNLKYKKK